jgi:hypothetical protein
MSVVRALLTHVRVPGRLAALALLLVVGGCADMATDLGLERKTPATIAADARNDPAVTTVGRPVAVLSIHTRKAYPNACKYGMTLTNNLPYKITTLSFRLTAVVAGDAPFDTQTKDFSQLGPGEQDYREMTFQGVKCSQITRIEVTDPGRCTMDKLNRFNSSPGDCARFTEVTGGSLVSVVKKAQAPGAPGPVEPVPPPSAATGQPSAGSGG